MPLTAEAVSDWIAAYVTAWRSNDPDDIRPLFTEDATYRYRPDVEPSVGLDAIVEWWLSMADAPSTWTFESEVSGVSGSRAFVEGRTVYVRAETWRTLWVIDFATDGRAERFTEWLVEEDRPAVVTKQAVAKWVAAYEKAWTTNDPQDIRALFAPGAEYRYEPYDEPEVDADAIVDSWLSGKDEPGTWAFESEVIATDGDLGVVEGRTVYPLLGRNYRNLWLIRLDDGGRATHFTEYYVEEKEAEQAAAAAGAV